MLGTAILVSMAVGAVAWTGMMVYAGGIAGAGGVPAFALLGSLAFGLSLIAIIYLIGPISGAHVNPAVSLAMLIRKKLSPRDFGFYVAAQTAGAIIGAAFVWATISLLHGEPTALTFGVNGYEEIAYNAAGSILLALMVETVLTFVFVLTIIGVVARSESKMTAPLAIGLTLALVHFVAFGITGTSVNPARSVGTALFGGTEGIRQVWLFIVAPLAGAVLAALAGAYFFDKDEAEQKK